jgi:hypothetical protein
MSDLFNNLLVGMLVLVAIILFVAILLLESYANWLVTPLLFLASYPLGKFIRKNIKIV